MEFDIAFRFICGLDFITGLKLSNNGRYVGTVVDPDTGKKYKCEVWYDSKIKKLAVRGELFIFGVTNYWPPIASENLPKEVVEKAAKFLLIKLSIPVLIAVATR